MLDEPTNRSWVYVGHRLVGWLVLLCVLAGAGCVVGHSRLDRPAWEQSRLIDLTHSFGADTIVWPTEQDFRLVLQQAGETPGGYYYASNRLEMAEHGGTHIDAPIHFSKGGQTLDQVPIEHLVGAGVRIDVTAQCARDRDTASPSKISSDGNQRTDEFRLARSCCSTRALPDIGRLDNSIWVQS